MLSKTEIRRLKTIFEMEKKKLPGWSIGHIGCTYAAEVLSLILNDSPDEDFVKLIDDMKKRHSYAQN